MANSDQLIDKVTLEHLKAGLERTFKQRFAMATKLYKIQQVMNRAVITHKSYQEK